MNAIWNMNEGQTVTFETWQGVEVGTFKFYRELTVRTRQPTYEVHMDVNGTGKCVYVGAHGEAVHYTDYTAKLVSVK